MDKSYECFLTLVIILWQNHVYDIYAHCSRQSNETQTSILVMGRCRYLTSVSVFGIFSSRFGIRYRYFKISRYRFGISAGPL